MCSRIEHETGTGTVICGREMDWNEPIANLRLSDPDKHFVVIMNDGNIYKNYPRIKRLDLIY